MHLIQPKMKTLVQKALSDVSLKAPSGICNSKAIDVLIVMNGGYIFELYNKTDAYLSAWCMSKGLDTCFLSEISGKPIPPPIHSSNRKTYSYPAVGR